MDYRFALKQLEEEIKKLPSGANITSYRDDSGERIWIGAALNGLFSSRGLIDVFLKGGTTGGGLEATGDEQFLLLAVQLGPGLIRKLVASGGKLSTVLTTRTAVAGTNASLFAKYAGTAKVLARGIWDFPAALRGELIEAALKKNTPRFFKVVDKFFRDSGRAISIKSYDLAKDTYQTAAGLRSAIQDDIRKFAAFKGAATPTYRILDGEVKARVLEIAIPTEALVARSAAQKLVLQEIIEYGRKLKVEVIIREISEAGPVPLP